MRNRAIVHARGLLGAALIAATLGAPAVAAAATLGQVPGFGDGHMPDVLELIDAQDGSPPPFDQTSGSDLFEDFAATWTFAGLPLGATAAIVTIGIFDHDSASPGSQLEYFTADDIHLEGDLDALFEASGGATGEYNVYSLVLPQSVIDALTDGSLTFALALKGPVITPPLILEDGTPLGDPQEDQNNGAALLFSSLEVDTTPRPIPEPSSFALLGLSALGLLALVAKRPRRDRT